MLWFMSCGELCWLQVELLKQRLVGAAQPPPAERERWARMTGAVSLRDGIQQRVPSAAVERRLRRAAC